LETPELVWTTWKDLVPKGTGTMIVHPVASHYTGLAVPSPSVSLHRLKSLNAASEWLKNGTARSQMRYPDFGLYKMTDLAAVI
jgi:hypothetical protein